MDVDYCDRWRYGFLNCLLRLAQKKNIIRYMLAAWNEISIKKQVNLLFMFLMSIVQ